MPELTFEALLRVAGESTRAFVREIGLEFPITAEEVMTALKEALQEVEKGEEDMHPAQIVAYMFAYTVLEMIVNQKTLSQEDITPEGG